MGIGKVSWAGGVARSGMCMGMGVGVDSPRETQLNSRSRNVQCTCIQACTARQMWPVSWEGVEGGIIWDVVGTHGKR